MAVLLNASISLDTSPDKVEMAAIDPHTLACKKSYGHHKMQESLSLFLLSILPF